MTVRTMRFFSRACVEGAVHRLFKSAASVTNDARAAAGAGVVASWAAILPSTSATCASALFQRASNSPATSRLAGSAAPYWRKARSAAKRAASRSRSSASRTWSRRSVASVSAETAAAMAPGSDDGEKRILDGVVDAQPAKGNAARLAIVHPAAAAAVAWNIVAYAGVAERQLSTAAAAADEPR